MPRQLSGINRALMWLRKVMEITESTESPRVLSEKLGPIIDVFGWDRLREAETVENVGAAATAFVVSGVTPQDVIRLCVTAQIESSDAAIAQDLWIAQRGVIGIGNDVAVGEIYSQAIGFATTPASSSRPVFLSPGERLVGHSTPAPGVGEQLTMRHRQIDLPFGEYISGLG